MPCISNSHPAKSIPVSCADIPIGQARGVRRRRWRGRMQWPERVAVAIGVGWLPGQRRPRDRILWSGYDSLGVPVCFCPMPPCAQHSCPSTVPIQRRPIPLLPRPTGAGRALVKQRWHQYARIRVTVGKTGAYFLCAVASRDRPAMPLVGKRRASPRFLKPVRTRPRDCWQACP